MNAQELQELVDSYEYTTGMGQYFSIEAGLCIEDFAEYAGTVNIACTLPTGDEWGSCNQAAVELTIPSSMTRDEAKVKIAKCWRQVATNLLRRSVRVDDELL